MATFVSIGAPLLARAVSAARKAFSVGETSAEIDGGLFQVRLDEIYPDGWMLLHTADIGEQGKIFSARIYQKIS